MIYTVTFNPSLDYVMHLSQFVPGMTNRSTSESLSCGGKGINVSIVLHNLGVESVALGFAAGFTGEEIIRGVEQQGCQTDFIRLPQGFSRINVKLKGGEESEINADGPAIPAEAVQQLLQRLDHLERGDILVLAGSIPSTLPDDIYQQIMQRLSDRGVRFVVDATRELLKKALPYRPFLIKPNNHELAELFEVQLQGTEDIVRYARRLQEMGAVNVLVSMAGDGAILVAEDGSVYQSPAPKGKVVNSVGAGDSMVAGFLAGYLHTGQYQEAFRMGVATGSASAFSPGLATKEQVEAVLGQL
ncbi:MAG: 1-phosphofructokinase [Eubacteriales bacterium]|jgi:1-phosphofructokinase